MCISLFVFFFYLYYLLSLMSVCFFFFKQKTAYEMRISDWSSDVCSSDLPSVPVTSAEFPLRLNTARYRDQWHTMTRTGLSPTLSQHRPEPLLEIHPADAHDLSLVDGGFGRVAPASGSAVYRVQMSEDPRRGAICVPMPWTDPMQGEGGSKRTPFE